ncbi:MAG: DUF1887 family protein [Eubacterium sp.]|nr:DUF1887 family protein [Eubacterium sp.]
MIIVEFFSEEALENIMALLSFHPERIIYLGHKHNMITKKMNSLRRFASITSPDTVLEFIEVPRDDLSLCIRTIEDICEEYPEAEFELTGGGEMFLIAFGYVAAGRKLRTLRIDPYTGTELRFGDKEMPISTQTDVKISVAENIVLHGGSLRPPLTDWGFDELLREEIQGIWNVAKRLGHSWNRYCSIIEEVVKNYPEDAEHVFHLPKAALKDAVTLLLQLRDQGMMDFYRTEKHQIVFRFANKQIREIVTKTGNILELHVYEVATREPSEFTDAVTGAIIDWDGGGASEGSADAFFRSETINEIDVILMRNAVPTFISCKSGRADSKALHELETVTSRFGGRYAKKVLVMATPCEVAASGGTYFKQRAKDMHIWVIDDVYSMTDAQLLRRLHRIQGN